MVFIPGNKLENQEAAVARADAHLLPMAEQDVAATICPRHHYFASRPAIARMIGRLFTRNHT